MYFDDLLQDDALEHLDYDNPLYHGMMGLDASQTSSDPFFKLDPSQVCNLGTLCVWSKKV